MAEFLRECSLTPLGVFHPPTCVGLRYGHHANSLRGFSRQCGISPFAALRPRTRLSEVTGLRIYLQTPPTGLDRDIQHPAVPTPLRLPLADNASLVVQEY